MKDPTPAKVALAKIASSKRTAKQRPCLPIPPEKPSALAEFLAENFKPKTIRDAYGELHRFLPHVEPTPTIRAKWAREAKASHVAIANLDLQNKQSLVELLFQVQGGHVSCRRAATEIQTRLKG